MGYSKPEEYVRVFVESVLRDVDPEARVSREVAVPGGGSVLWVDYAYGNVLIEAEAPGNRESGREQLLRYMKESGYDLGLLVDVPDVSYYSEHPHPYTGRVGFSLYRGDVLIYEEFFDPESVVRAKERPRERLRDLLKVVRGLRIATQSPTPEVVLAKVNSILERHGTTILGLVRAPPRRVKTYKNVWKNNMEFVYSKEVLEDIARDLDDLFARLTVYVTVLKVLGATVLEAMIGGRYTIPMRLAREGHNAVVELFWERRALTRFNVSYLFERDEYDWVFEPGIAQRLDAFFRDVGRELLEVDWSQRVSVDLLKRVYQRVVTKELRRQLGEFYTPDWIAKLVLWRALHALVRGRPPDAVLTQNVDVEVEELIQEFYERHGRIPSFIDPTCGSFTFGVQYLQALIGWYYRYGPPMNPVDFVRMVLESVVGIDLNPVAIVTAKVNYLLQVYQLLARRVPRREPYLHEEPMIPVYRLDLLLLHETLESTAPVKQSLSYYAGQDRLTLFIPLSALGIPDNDIDRLKRSGVSVVRRRPQDEEECIRLDFPRRLLTEIGPLTLHRALVALVGHGVEGFRNELEKVGVRLSDGELQDVKYVYSVVGALEGLDADGIWHSLLANYVLAVLAAQRRFDLVLGNLPWVNVSKYPENYGERLKEAAKKLGVRPPAEAAKKLDVSVVLFAVAARYLLGEGGIASLMVPTTIFEGLHGAAWRGFVSTQLRLLEVHDLKDVSPFEGAENQPGVVTAVKMKPEAGAFRYIKFSGTTLNPENFGDREPSYEDVLNKHEQCELYICVRDYVSVVIEDSLVSSEKTFKETLWLSKETYDLAKNVLGPKHVFYEAHEGVTFTGAKGAWLIEGEPEGVSPPLGISEECVRVETGLSRELELGPFIVEKKFVFRGIKGEDVEIGRVKNYRYFIAAYDKDGKPLNDDELQRTLLWKNYLSKSQVTKALTGTSAHLKKKPWHIERMKGKAQAQYKVVWRDVAREFVVAAVTDGAIPDYTVNYVIVSGPEEAFYLMAVLLAPQINAVVRELSPWIGHVQPRFMRYFKIPKYDPGNPIHRRLSEIGKAVHERGSVSEEEREEIRSLVRQLCTAG